MQMHPFNTGPADHVNHHDGDVARDGQWARVGDVIHSVVVTDTHYGIGCEGLSKLYSFGDLSAINCVTCLKMEIVRLRDEFGSTDAQLFMSADDDLF